LYKSFQDDPIHGVSIIRVGFRRFWMIMGMIMRVGMVVRMSRVFMRMIMRVGVIRMIVRMSTMPVMMVGVIMGVGVAMMTMMMPRVIMRMAVRFFIRCRRWEGVIFRTR